MMALHNVRVVSANGSRVSVYAGANGVTPGNIREEIGPNPLNEGLPAVEAGFGIPRGIAIDATGRVFVANRDFGLVSVIAPSLAVADIPPAQLSAAQQVRGASVISAGVVQSLFSDADGSTLSYSLVETSSAAVSFAIDSISGAITYLQPTEALANNTQTLVIAASDEQGTATSRLTVISEPLSNYPPQFRLSTSALTRAEGFADPITITINDPDDGDTDGIEQPITYSLRIAPNDLLAPFATFAIDPQSGTITITSISGVGAFGNITVRVIADDGSNSHSESEQSFTLTVTQVNNTPPVVAPSLRTVRTYAGSGVSDFADGSALTAQFNAPSGIARTTDGRLFIADSDNHRIRVISADGATVSTYAGDGVQNFADGSTTTANFRAPRGVALAADGRLFVADEGNNRIRVISADGATVSTYAGDGVQSFADGSTSTARFVFPSGVAVAADGRVFVADTINHRIRVISADGATVSTYAGSGFGFANGSTTTAGFSFPQSIAVAADGRVFVADAGNHRVRVISADGATVSTYAGDGVDGFADGSTTTARFDSPTDLVVASDGRLFVADTDNHRIRVISADGASVSTYAGSGATAQANAPQLESETALDIDLRFPQRMTLAPDGGLFFTDSGSHRIRVIEVVSSTSENFGSVTLGAGFQGAGTRVISAQNLFFDAEANDLTFSILSGNEDGLFAIDAASGRVTLADSLADTQTGINTLVIQAQDLAGSATVTLTIVVEEVNHAPTFALSASTLALDEDFGTNTDIVVVNPDDGDAAIEQTLTYSIFTHQPAALAALVTIAISTETGAVTLSSVDNAFGEVTLTVQVDDSSDTDNTAQQTFLLRINSVNDAPRFTLSDAAITLEEEFSENTSITVSSSDDGDGTNQPLTYSISPASTGFATLAIDAQSGSVTITSIAEGFGSAVITVTVDDASAINNVATQTFMLTVSNVNDAPNLTLSTNVLTLNEDFGSNVVGIIENADDGDGTNQVLSYSVSSNNVGFSTLTINPQSGRLTLTSIADAFGEATLTITVTDSSATNNEATQVLRLRVLSVNDPPAFSLSTTTLRLTEDFTQAITVSVVNPNDGDDDMEQTLTYSISPVSLGVVAISFDANSGQVILNSVADANSINPILFEITANDGGALNNLFSQAFTLEIEPVDDPGNDPPNVVLSTAVLTLDEDFGSASITVVSSDDGDGTNQPLTYSISPNNIGFATISIDSNSGAITLSSVDNQFGQATLFVTVDDSDPEDNLSIIQVVVRARSVNDVPAFTLSRTALTLDEDFGRATVNVASSDDGDNGVQTLSYTISTMNVGFATLTIDSASGEVRLSSVLDAIGSAAITVTVDDSSAANNVATQTFTLTVNEVNDPPVFALSTTVLTLNEDFGTNTSISVVSANDGDNGDQVITYRINPTNTGFATLAIDAQTGEVTISSVANGFGSAVITVIAEDDGGGDTNQSTQTFMLTVLDVVDSVLAQRISVYAGQVGDNALVNGSSSTARFDTPKGLALRADGSLLIVDSGNNVIRLISADGATVSTYPDSSATSTFNQLADIAATVDGRVFVADSGAQQILVISADGSTISVYAGSGDAGSENGNSLATAQFIDPVSLAVAEDGRLFIGDVGSNRIRVINANGSAVSTYFDGEGRFVPNDISIAADGRIFVADTDNNRIAVINAAGTAVANYAGANAGYVDGAIASAQFNQPQAAFIAGRTVFVADSNNDVVRLIDARASTVSTLIADTGDLVLDAPAGIVVSTDGSSVFIADQNNHRIVLVETGNNLPTISAPATFSLPVNANRSVSVTATDTDETGSLSFQVSGGADLLTLTTATNSLIIRSGSDMGSTTLTLHTSDSLGAQTYAELVVTVTAQPASSGGGGGGGCSLQSESGAIDWTLWLLALLSLAALRGYRRRVS